MNLDKNLNKKEIQLERSSLRRSSEINEIPSKNDKQSPKLSQMSNEEHDFINTSENERFQKNVSDDFANHFTDRKGKSNQ